jgi:hypothetical protein
MAESVKVIIRCRPMNTREKDLKCKVSCRNYMMYYLKRNKTAITHFDRKIEKAGSSYVINSSTLPFHTRVKFTVLARTLLTPIAQKLCRLEHGILTIRTWVYADITSHRNNISNVLPVNSAM